MIITCQECNTSFRLDENLIKPEGSKVRCSRCRHVFTAYPPSPATEARAPEPVPEAPEAEEESRQEAEAGGIDLAELDAIFGGEMAAAGDSRPSPEEPEEAAGEDLDGMPTSELEEPEDLDLDFDMELEPDGATVDEDTTRIDDLDLDLDFDLEDEDLEDEDLDLEESAGAGGPRAKQEAAEDPDLADDLDIKDELELELDSEDVAEAGADKAEPELELDLDAEDEPGGEAQEPELELDLEPEQSTAGAGELSPESSDEKIEDLALELESDQETGGEDAGAELDFSDIETVFEDDTDQDDDLKLEIDEEKEEQELELELESASKEPQPVEELEDLEFQLDSEFDEKDLEEAGGPADQDAEEELDLTDIEQMLEQGPSADGAGNGDEQQESRADDLVIQDELDLEELEQAIEEADQEGDEKGADQELELDLPDSVESEPAGGDDDLDLELDISEIEQPVEDDVSRSASVTMDTGDIELQFEIEDGQPSEDEERPVPMELEEITQTVQVDEEAAGLAPDKAEKKPAAPAPGPAPAPAKKGVSKTLVFLLVIVVLGGIGYGLYYAVTKMGVQIPYLSDYLKPQPQDPYGTLHLSTFDIASKFMENQNDGRLFVITGKVRNGYDHPRAMIRVRGNLFTTGKKLVKTEYAYCGVVLSDSDLVQKPFAEIKQLLNQRPSGEQAGGGLQPGQAVQFMVVFANLPENLEEFTIELVGSAPAGQ